ncbi:MAG: carbohydrate kinase family protein [Brachymonas sp.]|nr:carbohydrate kinase family protein [Brachymonas sp.]
MSILISGSIAFDNILSLSSRFADHILPEQIDKLSLSLHAPHMRSDFGGCAGNIAYAVRQLGSTPVPLATVGKDSAPYLQRLQALGISTDHVAVLPDCYTAQCTIFTDAQQNQITAFHPGAMGLAHQSAVPVDGIQLAIVSPNGKEAMQTHADQLHAAGVDFVFDPGQAMPLFDGAELRRFIDMASWLTLNDYEAHMLTERVGMDRAALSREVRGLVVTLGEQGCEVWQGGQRDIVPAVPPQQAVDPTGCGDAWRGALLHGLHQGWDLLRCARLGNYLGSVKVAHRGPQNYQLDPEAVARY